MKSSLILPQTSSDESEEALMPPPPAHEKLRYTLLPESSNPMKGQDPIQQWSQWQLLDSILPTGGFAHSSGLEAAVQTGMISTADDLKSYIHHLLENAASLLLPFVHATAHNPTADAWHTADKILDATLNNEAARKASTSQGSSLMRIAAAVFTEFPSLKSMRDGASASASGGLVSFHHAPVFGLVCGTIGMDSGSSQRAFLFVTMRDAVSAATRLNLVGPLGGAMLQHQMASMAEELCRRWMDRPIEDACQTVPLLDTVQGCHGYLFSRLFSS